MLEISVIGHAGNHPDGCSRWKTFTQVFLASSFSFFSLTSSRERKVPVNNFCPNNNQNIRAHQFILLCVRACERVRVCAFLIYLWNICDDGGKTTKWQPHQNHPRACANTFHQCHPALISTPPPPGSLQVAAHTPPPHPLNTPLNQSTKAFISRLSTSNFLVTNNPTPKYVQVSFDKTVAVASQALKMDAAGLWSPLVRRAPRGFWLLSNQKPRVRRLILHWRNPASRPPAAIDAKVLTRYWWNRFVE